MKESKMLKIRRDAKDLDSIGIAPTTSKTRPTDFDPFRERLRDNFDEVAKWDCIFSLIQW